VSKPWFSQVTQFCQKYGYEQFPNMKVKLAVLLAESCHCVPITFTQLAQQIASIRNQNPVKHPDHV
jgi:DNA-binding MurR/RpiR family transcriptional regulator